MLWACLHFPDLPLRAVFDDAEQAQPCAVVDGPRNRLEVAFANAAARRHGVQVGRVLAVARASCAALQARPRDRAGEGRLLLSLAAWAYRFSSQVSVSEPDALLIEVGASLRLFGGWPALERRLRAEMRALGHAPAIAAAPVAAAARVLAAQRDGFCTDQPGPMLAALGAVPLARSGLAANTIALLYNVGARTLRDAFALPRPELGRRIGAAQLEAIDSLRGAVCEPLPLYRPPDRFEHRVELEDRVEAWPPLLFPLRRLCGELALFLAARDGGVQRCELALDIEDRPVVRIGIELLSPQRDARVLYDLVRSRLEHAALPGPVCAIALIAKDLPEFRPRHHDLFEPQRAQGLEWSELAERLRAHLGDDAVRRLAVAADYRPERAWRFAAAGGDDAKVERRKTAPAARPRARSAPRSPSAAVGTEPPLHVRDAGMSITTYLAGETSVSSPVPPPETAPIALPPAHVAARFSPLPLAAEAAPPLAPIETQKIAVHALAPEAGPVRVAPPIATTSSKKIDAAPETIESNPSPARPSRPLWLLHRAMPLRGPAPRILAGPERVESGWWDGGDTRRDYYVVQMRTGQRAWAYLSPGARDGWMLHGWFA